MRVPSAGRRRSAALAAALACAVAVLVHAAAAEAGRGARATPRLDDAGYLAVADRLQRRLDAALERRARRYEPGLGRDRRARSTPTCCSSTRWPRCTATRAGAPRRPRALRSRASSSARRSGRRAAGRRRPAGPGAGWVAAPGRRTGTWCSTPRSSTGWSQAYLARDALGLDARHGRAHPRRDPRAWRRATTSAGRRCGSTRSTGTARCPRRTRSSTAQRQALADGLGGHLARFLAGGRRSARRGQPRGGSALSLPARTQAAPAMNVDSAEYANIVLSFSRFYGAARRAGHAAARAGRPAARLGPARRRRLLDARRLPQLGHRARLLALAPAQEGRRSRSRR